jgi:acyl-coenzyme A thioesterase PaaI-like protein
MNDYDESVPPINDDTVGHYCFGCGDENPFGLRLRFRPLGDDGVWAAFTPAREHEGYLGLTHGGILTTVLDEAMSWAATHTGDLGVTARLTLTFRRAARVGAPLRVSAWVLNRRSRTIDSRAELRDTATGELLVEAEARFVRVSKEQAAAWRAAYSGTDDSAFGRAAARNAGTS